MEQFEFVKSRLQQRFPLLMVDRVIEWGDEGSSIRTIKNVSGNEICFLGHFPHYSILPGVYIIEAIAQSASILFSADGTPTDDELTVLGYVNDMRFFKPVVPGDQLEIQVDVVKKVPGAGIVEGQVFVDRQLVAKGRLTFGKKKLSG